MPKLVDAHGRAKPDGVPMTTKIHECVGFDVIPDGDRAYLIALQRTVLKTDGSVGIGAVPLEGFGITEQEGVDLASRINAWLIGIRADREQTAPPQLHAVEPPPPAA